MQGPGDETLQQAVSVGVAARAAGDEHGFDKLLEEADLGVHAAKHAGRNRVHAGRHASEGLLSGAAGASGDAQSPPP